MKGRYKNLYTSQIISVYKRKSYKRNMMFLFAKLTKEIIFVCTIFLFIYTVTDLCTDFISALLYVMNAVTKAA